MRIDVTQKLSIERSDGEVIAMIRKAKNSHAENILRYIENEDCDFKLPVPSGGVAENDALLLERC